MSILSRLRAQARYNVLTPVFLLSLGVASPALAANTDRVVTAPTADFVLDANDSLTNRSTITGATNFAVYAPARVRFIDNEANGSIVSANYIAVALSQGADSFSNAGTIRSDTRQGVYSLGGINTFVNTSTGLISADLRAVEIIGAVDSFTNAGEIQSLDGSGVSISGRVNRFENSGTIEAEDTGVVLGTGAGSFSNSGTIISDNGLGVISTQRIESFTNTASGVISTDETALYVATNAGRIDNSGIITSDDAAGVIVVGQVNDFVNSGTITGAGTGVRIGGHAVNFTNSGEIRGTNVQGVYIGSVGTFNNSKTIASIGSTGVYIFGDVGKFTNSGTIRSNDNRGVYIGGTVTEFNNSDKILSNQTGVYINGITDTFVNSGEISSEQHAVYFDKFVRYFKNTDNVISNTVTDHSGVYFNQSVETIENTSNIRSAGGDGIYVGDNLGALINTKPGIIDAYDTAVYVLGNVGSILNSGKIRADDTAIRIIGTLGEFNNSGTVISEDTALYVEGRATKVVNSGLIQSNDSDGMRFESGVDTVINFKTIEADENGIYSRLNSGSISNYGLIDSSGYGVHLEGNLDEFVNSGTISSYNAGLYVDYDLGSFANSGEITSTNNRGVTVYRLTGDFKNSGTITGVTGVYIETGGAKVINSGTIASSNGVTALEFNGDDNTLVLGTGARFVGEVDFGGRANTYLDARNFHGSIGIDVTANSLDMGNIYAGDNYYYQDNDEVLIVGGGFVSQSSQPVANLVSGLGELVTTKLALGDAISNPADLTMNYAARPQSQAEAATADALATGALGTTYWADAIGGVGRNAGAETGDVYGALIAGAHTQVTADLTLGVLGGFAQTHLDIGNGAQTIKSTVGIVGAYGSYDMGGLQTDFSLIGGLSGNDSDREMVTGPAITNLTASYGGWFIAPTVGAYVPVLTTETAEISIGGRLGYLGGGFSGYTEGGNGLPLVVDAQSYGVVTALLEVRGENAVSDTVTVNGSLGVFAQNQHGNAVNVSILNPAIQLVGPDSVGGTSLGVKAGLGAEMALSDAFNVNAGVTGNWRSSGTIAASANLGIGGKF